MLLGFKTFSGMPNEYVEVEFGPNRDETTSSSSVNVCQLVYFIQCLQ